MLECERLNAAGIMVLRLHGEIEGSGEYELRREMDAVIAAGHRTVVFNLAGVQFISYRGVGVLVGTLSRLRAIKGELRLSGLNLQGSRLMEGSGVGHIFDHYDIEHAAIVACKPEAA